jgi:hypothetical protein
MRATIVFTGIAVASLGISCKTTWSSPYSGHCANQSGDDWCAAEYPDGSRPFCSRGISGCEEEMDRVSDARDGCVPTRPADDACYSPCGGSVDVTEDATCLDAVSSSSGSSSGGSTEEPTASDSGSESSTTGPMPCTGNEDCLDAATPFCEPVSGVCVSCDGMADPDGACAGADPLRPLCTDGTCVACTPENPLVCDEQLLLCDGGTNACVPCTEHEQCGSGACELAMGRCFPPDTVVHVDGDGGQDFPSVAAAVASIGAGLQGVIVVHEQNSGLGYSGTLIDEGKIIALIAAIGETPVLLGTAGNPGLRAEGATTVLYVDGLQIAGNTMGLGLRANDAFVWVDRSSIVQNSGGGVLVENGADVTLRNCFVGRNGDEFADTRGITAASSVLDVNYTTVAANDGTGASGPISMSCDGATIGEVRNSIVAAGDGTIDCASVSFSFNVVDTAGLAGSDNDVLSFDPLAWFPGIAMSDFHITMGPPFADAAEWSTGDPLTDIDGDPRPAIDGTPDYAGADVP